jgi:flagellar basal-body rod protein FlgC
MTFEDLFAVTRISASGLSAERLRMEVIANNLANAFQMRPFGRGKGIAGAVANSNGQSALRVEPLNRVRNILLNLVATIEDLITVQRPGILTFCQTATPFR